MFYSKIECMYPYHRIDAMSRYKPKSRLGPNSKSKADSQEEPISQSLPIPIIPPTLPGWSGADLPRRSSPAFPEDTTHTYEMSVCAATSRGYAATQSKVGRQLVRYVGMSYHSISCHVPCPTLYFLCHDKNQSNSIRAPGRTACR